jgi:ribonuclease HI
LTNPTLSKEQEAGVVLIPPKGDIFKYAVQFEFPATNNIVEYEGLVTGLQLAKEPQHLATPYQGRFLAGSETSANRI